MARLPYEREHRMRKNDLYEIRKISDIRDMLYDCGERYAERTAYYVKDEPGGPYRSIRYKQLRSNLDGLGTSLLALGLKGKKIALIGENSYEWALTYCTVSSGVGVVVPLDRELPLSELKNLMMRSGVNAVVYSRRMEKAVLEAAGELPQLEYLIGMGAETSEGKRYSFWELVWEGERKVKNGDRSYMDTPVDPNVMSVLLFTSGTTGLAKGVMLSQKNIVSNVMNMSKYVNASGYIGLSVLPMHHTYEMTCHILTGMYWGISIGICEGLKYIQKNMEELHPNVLLAVPAIFEAMYKKVWRQAEKSGKAKKMKKGLSMSKKLHLGQTPAARKMFKEVHEAFGGEDRLWISGGAAIDPGVIEDFRAMGFNMIQGYGMTENSPIIAVNKDFYSKPASAGLPMPGTDVRIVNADESGIGEIICKGPSVMLGYYENPEETSKVLKDGWLYTGDYGYFDKEGFLYVTGRKKNVIVTKNGKNIFPEEVEYYLNKSDYIAEVMVYGLEEENGETVVCADIFPDFAMIEAHFGETTEEELRKVLKRELDRINEQMSTYKWVRRFDVRHTEFEKTTTRKIKRHLAGHNSAEK